MAGSHRGTNGRRFMFQHPISCYFRSWFTAVAGGWETFRASMSRLTTAAYMAEFVGERTQCGSIIVSCLCRGSKGAAVIIYPVWFVNVDRYVLKHHRRSLGHHDRALSPSLSDHSSFRALYRSHTRWMQMERIPFYEGFCVKGSLISIALRCTAAPADAEGLSRDPLCWNAWLKSAVTSSLPTLFSAHLRASHRASDKKRAMHRDRVIRGIWRVLRQLFAV